MVEFNLVFPEIYRRYVVDFRYCLNAESRFEIKGASLHVFNEDGSVNWRFETIYDHFELFLGMTMASFATADKLSRAISINRDRNMFASEDGTFLVDMLISFIDLSICKAGEFPPIQEGNFSTLSVEIGPLSNFVRPQGGKNICEVLSGLKTILLNVVSDLEAGSEYEMILESELAVRTADDLLAASMIFTDFIHPVWNRIHRTGFFDLIFLERWKTSCSEKLAEKKGACSTFFSNLMA